MNLVFLDSCIVIDYINGKINLDNGSKHNYCFNTVVEMEILVGAKNKRDLHTTNKKLLRDFHRANAEYHGVFK